MARCWADARDLEAEIVPLSWAIDFLHYSRAFYEAEEQEALCAKRGLRACEFHPAV